MSTFSFNDDGSPITDGKAEVAAQGPSWLPTDAAGKYLDAYAYSIEEAVHTFADRRGPKKFLKVNLRVRWNSITYQTETAFWNAKAALPFMRAVGVKTVDANPQSPALKKVFTALFQLNSKGYITISEYHAHGTTTGRRPAMPPASVDG